MSSKISVNDQVPVFELEDQKGDLFKVTDFLGRKNLVIYFYPKDYTPGCTSEAESFRDWYDDFFDLDCEVIGISADKCTTHNKFTKRFNLPFILLSDKGNKIRKLFGVPSLIFGLVPGRVTYVIDKEGRVRRVFNSLTKPEEHANEALKALRDFSQTS